MEGVQKTWKNFHKTSGNPDGNKNIFNQTKVIELK